MTCQEIEIEINRIFNEIKSQAKNGNITDEMVIKTNFNSLKQLAEIQCKDYYSIEYSSSGYVLVKK